MDDIEVENLEHLRLFGHHFEIICGTNEEYLIAFTIKYAQVMHSNQTLLNQS